LLKVYRSKGNALIVYVKPSKNKVDLGWAKYGPRRLLVRPGGVVLVQRLAKFDVRMLFSSTAGSEGQKII